MVESDLGKLSLGYSPLSDRIYLAEMRREGASKVVVGDKVDFSAEAVGAVFEMMKSNLDSPDFDGDRIAITYPSCPGYELSMSKVADRKGRRESSTPRLKPGA